VTKEELNRQRFFYPLQAVGVEDEALAERFSEDFFAIIPTKRSTPAERILRDCSSRKPLERIYKLYCGARYSNTSLAWGIRPLLVGIMAKKSSEKR